MKDQELNEIARALASTANELARALDLDARQEILDLFTISSEDFFHEVNQALNGCAEDHHALVIEMWEDGHSIDDAIAAVEIELGV
jgi:hypothetical protein